MDACLICGGGCPVFDCKAALYPGKILNIVSCPACGSRYYSPVPASEEVARCYPHAYFRDFFKQYWKDYYKGRALAQELRRLSARGRFLDVGCALGTLLAGVRDFSGWEVSGLEYAQAAAGMGRRLHGLEIAPGGLADAPWPDASFAYVHINNVLEHERDPLGALRAAARLLSPGGLLRLVVPNGPVDIRAGRDLYLKEGLAVHTRHGGHLFFLGKRALGLLLERAGFRVLSCRGFHFKLALKAAGLWPGAYRPFLRPLPPPPREDAEPDLDAYKRLIPPKPSWPLYALKQRWRRLGRLPGVSWGYDFDILARRR